MEFFEPEELMEMVNQLNLALFNHAEWHNSIIRTLVCRVPPDHHDLQKDAHKQCRFGQWYYEDLNKKFLQSNDFNELGDVHHKMHITATKLLQLVDQGESIPIYDYDNLANLVQRVQLQLTNLQRKLEDQLHPRDKLTGALNGSNMLPLLRELQAQSKRTQQTYTITLGHLDHFSSVIEQYNPAAGDFVLKSISRTLHEHLRVYDKLFRVGEDKFLICLQDADKQITFKIIERVRKYIASHPVVLRHTEPISITMSFGIAVMEPHLPIEDVLDNAEQALFKAEEEGKNRTRT